MVISMTDAADTKRSSVNAVEDLIGSVKTPQTTTTTNRLPWSPVLLGMALAGLVLVIFVCFFISLFL